MFIIRRAIVPVLVLAALGAAACQPPAVKVAPVPDRVAMSGDSISLQALYYGSTGTPAHEYDTYNKIGLGWRAAHAQPQVTADVASPTASPTVEVIAFGHNYTGTDGYTLADRNEMTAFTFSPHESACVVMVKPAAGPQVSTLRRQTISDYRAHVDQLAQARPHTVTVDWAAVVAEHPEYLDTDGIHLTTPDTDPAQDLVNGSNGEVSYTDPGAARAFVNMVMEGVAAC